MKIGWTDNWTGTDSDLDRPIYNRGMSIAIVCVVTDMGKVGEVGVGEI